MISPFPNCQRQDFQTNRRTHPSFSARSLFKAWPRPALLLVDGQKCEMEQRAHFPLGKITLVWGCEAWRTCCCHIWMPHPFSGCCGRCCRMRLAEIPTLSKYCHGGDHTLKFGCCSQNTLFMSVGPLQCPGESPDPGQDKV